MVDAKKKGKVEHDSVVKADKRIHLNTLIFFFYLFYGKNTCEKKNITAVSEVFGGEWKNKLKKNSYKIEKKNGTKDKEKTWLKIAQ